MQKHHIHYIDGHTIHQRVEQVMRHRLMLGVMVGAMAIAGLSLVKRDEIAMQRIYSESFSWISTHMHHEHPTHSSAHARIAKLPTISGGRADA
jgi:hypothetical protein